ncbi:hypothetical protein LX32DRAFT_694284 [Colletotrichum zoysiae]|uniref:Uncharacterized protein n=1 Tax=Colletotrichum zoysiae TaxID=1216348 RepID=A0AAD9M4D3_9PEZI|nr:hypothetical protein LX32DRAFT_694284 [Colletotrichum zoysiae]
MVSLTNLIVVATACILHFAAAAPGFTSLEIRDLPICAGTDDPPGSLNLCLLVGMQ